jgi:hypothetical protein
MALAYVTDLEGMYDKLVGFATDNPLVRLEDHRLVVARGAVLVYGGDVLDRGPGAMALMHSLLEAKLRQPEQVVLLAGNRDLNKLRLTRELGGLPLARTPEELKRGPRPDLLRWIFRTTMGAPDAFDHRQTELLARGEAASDEDVVDSVLADVAPGGLLQRYLEASQLAYRHGSTLFVHGGLTEQSLGLVPGRRAPPDHPGAVEIEQWTHELNGWLGEMLAAYTADPMAPPASAPWQTLIAYQAPLPGGRTNPGSVVYGRTADDDNNLRLPAAAVIAALSAQGMRRLVIGHTPSGDSPSLLRRGDFELVCADNSHARHAHASQVFMTDEHLEVIARTTVDDDGDGGEPGPAQPVRLARQRGEEGPMGLREHAGGALVCGRLAAGR